MGSFRKMLKWIVYNILGGKKREAKIKWKEDLLKKYREQDTFHIKIDPITIERTFIGGIFSSHKVYSTAYTCKYSTDKFYYQDIGDTCLTDKTRVWIVWTYERGLKLCLKQFERYLELKNEKI